MDIRASAKLNGAPRRLAGLIIVLVALASLGGAPLAATASSPPARAADAAVAEGVAVATQAKSPKSKHKSAARKKPAKKKPAKKKKKPAKRKPSPPVPAPAPVSYGTPLVGTFKIAPGAFSATGGPAGSYLRMVLAGGTIAAGPYFDNLFSGSSDKTYTLITPGSDGGLLTGSYQPAPSPAFGGLLNSALANRIMAPQAFEGINFSVSTQPVDPQTGQAVPPPGINDLDGKLDGEVAAVTAEWANNYFNQGTPKPDGSTPGLTQPVTGTYDAGTGAYVLEWASTIVGGPFNHFTGYWHLAGTFQPSN
ncbi:MAG TPA: hypothetical protein VIJ51_17755 [Solirubrobacteraceae bacterium]